MDASIATKKANSHVRSNSFPSKSHPLVDSVEDQLQRLRSSEAASTSPSTVCKNLASLKDLFECVNNLLQLPVARKAFCNEQQDKRVEDVLDGSLRLLDICGNIRDVFSHMKGYVQDLESSLRRRNDRESSLAHEIEKYFISRKKVNKMVSKCSDNLRIMQKGNLALLDKGQELVHLVGLLREVEAVSFSLFNSLLSFICPSKARSKTNSWSLVSKLIRSKRLSCEEEENEEDMINVDSVLGALIRNKSSKAINMTQVLKAQKGLETMESTMEEIEEGLECVFRCLIKSRVSLLNILNH